MDQLNPLPPPASTSPDTDRILAALSWLWVLSVVILVLGGQRPFVRFHARQAVALFGLSILAWIVSTVLGITGLHVQGLLQLLVFIVVVLGFLQALRGRWWELKPLARLAARVGL